MKKDSTVIKFSRECRKFFLYHVNCLNSGKIQSQNFISYALLGLNHKLGFENLQNSAVSFNTLYEVCAAQAEGVEYRLMHTRTTGWGCAGWSVQAEGVQAEGVQYRLRDAEQRVSLSLYCTPSAYTLGMHQPVLHPLSPYCTNLIYIGCSSFFPFKSVGRKRMTVLIVF